MTARTRPATTRRLADRPAPTARPCCTPFPVATFRAERLVSVDRVHRGPVCVGAVEAAPLSDYGW